MTNNNSDNRYMILLWHWADRTIDSVQANGDKIRKKDSYVVRDFVDLNFLMAHFVLDNA